MGLIELAAALLCVAGQVSFIPELCDVVLDPGDEVVVETTLVVPAFTTFAEIDIYFLADTTGSMGPIIDDVVDEARALFEQIVAFITHPNLRFGVGRYRDFPLDAFAFDHVLSPIEPGPAFVAALESWVPLGGSDGSEAQLFALHRLAVDPAIGFGEQAKRVVFWFGDAPGHDPICPAMSGEEETITEESVKADLASRGAGGTVVLAAGVASGSFYAAALDDDPQVSAQNYIGTCAIGGAPGQGTRIADASGGALTFAPTTTLTSEALFESWLGFIRNVRVTVEPTPEIAPFVVSIDPPFYDITIPHDPENPLMLPFSVTFAADACTENQTEFHGRLKAQFDGAPAQGTTKRVNISQPACDTQCLLLAGLTPVDMTLPSHGGPGPADGLYVMPLLMLPVTMDDIPALPLPDDPALIDLHVFTQIYMDNGVDFPGDPIKTSNALDFTIGGAVTPYGAASGMQQWADLPAVPGGTVAVSFSIDGFGG